MRGRVSASVLLFALASPLAARAQSLDVRADAAARVVLHKGDKIPIELPPGEITATTETVAVGEGRAIAHVVARTKNGDATWEALVAPAEGGGDRVLFAGRTGFASGEGGERRGQAVTVLPKDGGGSFVVVGGLDESVAICGEPKTLLDPRALDPKTMTLRSAAVQQLSAERRANATKLVARVRKDPPEKPLGRLLVAVGGTDERAPGAALVDGDVTTRWHEARSGTGLGEAVVLRAPNRVTIPRLTFVPLPPKPEEPKGAPKAPKPAKPDANDLAQAAAPKSLYLVTDTKTYAIEFPEDASASRVAFDVSLPEPLRTTCVALVLDDAYARGQARPEVSLSEVIAYSELDAPGATLADAARALGGGGAPAEAAAEVLKRGGPAAAEALAPVAPTLDERGRMLALSVASAAGGCDAGARVLVRALSDPSKEIASRAEKALLACGPSAAPRLLESMEKDDPITKGRSANILALVAPSRALKPIALALGPAGAPTKESRPLLRGAFARAAKRASADAIAQLLADAPREARPDLLRALAGRLGEVRERASLATNEWLEKDGSFAARYLALEPLAELARAGDSAATTRFVAMLGGDPEWGVRAHAAALAAPVAAAQGALLHALEDAEPRVREAALRAVAERGTTAAAVRVGGLLAHDPWTFVRTAAAGALGGMGAAPDIDRALADSLGDASSRVRVEALEALGKHRASSFAAPVRERLEDDHEPLEVRVAAVTTLGRMCDGESLDTFTKAARKLAQPFPEQSELDLGAASVRALATVHPKDLERRLAPLLGKDVKATVRELATRALAEPGECR